jgi:hypothetical protein
MSAESSSGTIPGLFEQLEGVLRTELEFKHLKVDTQEKSIYLTVRCSLTDVNLLVRLREPGLILVMAFFDLRTPEERKTALHQLAGLRNQGFAYGCDVPYEQCYLHQTYHFVTDEILDRALAAHLIAGAISSAEQAYPLVMAVVFGGKSPEEVLAEAKAKEDPS